MGVARSNGGMRILKRIMSLFVVAALMAAMMVASALPAFAQGNSERAKACHGAFDGKAAGQCTAGKIPLPDDDDDFSSGGGAVIID